MRSLCSLMGRIKIGAAAGAVVLCTNLSSTTEAAQSSLKNGGTVLLTPIFQALTHAIEAASLNQSKNRSSLVRLRQELLSLERSINGRTVPLPEEYKIAFEAYPPLVAQLGTSERSAESLIHDVTLKSRFLDGSAAFWPFDKKPLVMVRVLTMRGAVPAPGYGVSFNPLIDANRFAARFPFASDTNEAKRELPPGNYYLRLYLGERHVFTKQVPVGVQGLETEEIKLDVSAISHAGIEGN